MDRGAYRHSIVLQNPGAPVPDGDGGFTAAWTNLVPFWWARILPATAKGLERVVAGTVLSVATHIVCIRYLLGVTTQTRILFGTRILNIVGVQNPGELDAELVLVCAEVIA